MYDGSDTAYYLSLGYRVVAVEANAELVERAKKSFALELSRNQLQLVHAAVCGDSGADVTLTISGEDLGSSSTIEGQVADRNPVGSYQVPGVTVTELVANYGLPFFMKVDLEGADRYCVLPLSAGMRPDYISFEAGEDVEELVGHLAEIGYTRFKAINQCNFKELSRQRSWVPRAKRGLVYVLGYRKPRYVRRRGRFFLLDHSAGPAPWVSDGRWQDLDAWRARWKSAIRHDELDGWYDVHAM